VFQKLPKLSIAGELVTRSKVRSALRAVVFIATVAAIYSLGHGLRTFTGMPRST